MGPPRSRSTLVQVALARPRTGCGYRCWFECCRPGWDSACRRMRNNPCGPCAAGRRLRLVYLIPLLRTGSSGWFRIGNRIASASTLSPDASGSSIESCGQAGHDESNIIYGYGRTPAVAPNADADVRSVVEADPAAYLAVSEPGACIKPHGRLCGRAVKTRFPSAVERSGHSVHEHRQRLFSAMRPGRRVGRRVVAACLWVRASRCGNADRREF